MDDGTGSRGRDTIPAILMITLLVVVCLATAYFYVNTAEKNNKYHTANITVIGKICRDEIGGTMISKIQGADGTVYFIPNNDCDLYPIGRSGMIFYQHVTGMQIFGSSSLSFNQTVGNYP
jgi:hypothetical protein